MTGTDTVRRPSSTLLGRSLLRGRCRRTAATPGLGSGENVQEFRDGMGLEGQSARHSVSELSPSQGTGSNQLGMGGLPT